MFGLLTLRAGEGVGELSTIDTVDHPLKRCAFDGIFKLVEDHRDELLSILLHTDIYRFATETFERVTEVMRCEVEPCCAL